MTRTDIHRPSAIIPSDYQFVALGYQKIEGIGDVYAVQEERARLKTHMERTGGWYSRHEHGGNCHICGAGCIYTVIFYHPATNSYIRTGMDCATKMDMGDEVAFRMFRDAIKAAQEHKAGKLKAQGILEQAGLTRAWELYTEGWNDKWQFEERTITDIVAKLVKYGNISQKQEDFLRKLLDQMGKRDEIQAKRAAEKALAADVPEGRQTIKGEVLKTEVRDGMYGTEFKMAVKAEAGFVLWGTIPDNLRLFDDAATGYQRRLTKGDRIELTATIERSEKDPKFGFFKRPKAKLV